VWQVANSLPEYHRLAKHFVTLEKSLKTLTIDWRPKSGTQQLTSRQEEQRPISATATAATAATATTAASLTTSQPTGTI
jgi:hypothetical protein